MITPLENYPELAKALNIKKLYFKREDLHPYGSHKGRSIPPMIDHYLKNSDKDFVISSSGNAALAAAIHADKLAGAINLEIYVGNHISKNKLVKIEKFTNDNIHIIKKERPLRALTEAIQQCKRSLRQSTDDMALIGYNSLAEELAHPENIGAVFIGTSSGTTSQALAQYFIDRKLNIQVHIIQTSSCHAMIDNFDRFDFVDEKSIADAIVDQSVNRKSKLIPLINKTGGRGWYASNENIISAQRFVHQYTGLEISPNSALSVVGVMQAVYVNHEINGGVVCIICGE